MHESAIIVGVVAPWLAMALGAAGYILSMRFGSRPQALAYLDQEVQQLEKQNKELSQHNARLTAENASLRQATNFTDALRPFIEELRNHESRAADRSNAMLAIMQQIADLLGPDAEA